ncbi:unnamed protein product [Caenorhabditis angaria]|uniref:Tudor domain-containing protein n=1 Tax=Caenorhabditis angaria TaxID=860376 RepID=A0A9P1I5E0_9PELO|nr:unnamed protein product [Caenorhabditis angaria]
MGVADDVHSVVLTLTTSGKPMTPSSIEKEWKDLRGVDLNALIRKEGLYSRLNDLLASNTHLFTQQGYGWLAVQTSETQEVTNVMRASRGGKRNGGNSRGGNMNRGGGRSGGGGIPRVDHNQRYGSAFHNPANSRGRGGFNNSGGFGGGGGGGGNDRINSRPFRSQQQYQPQPPPPPPIGLNPTSSRYNGNNTNDFGSSQQQQHRRSPSYSPPRRNYSTSRRNSPAYDDDRDRPSFARYEEPVRQTRYEEPIRQARYEEPVRQERYEEPVRQPRYEEPVRRSPVFGRQNVDDRRYQRSTSSFGRKNDDDGYDRDRDRDYGSSSNQRNGYNDDNGRMSRSRSQYDDEEGQSSSFQRHRSQSRSMRDVRTTRENYDSSSSYNDIPRETPMTNQRANDLLIRSGIDSLSINDDSNAAGEKDKSAKNTKQKAANLLCEIFNNNNGGSLKVEEVIRLLNQHIDLPLKKYGDVGALEKLKADKPKSLQCMEIDRTTRTVHWRSIRSDSPPPLSTTSSSRRPDSELLNNSGEIHNQLELTVLNSMSMRDAISRLKFDTDDVKDKINIIALAILIQNPKVFQIDKLDETGTIVRIRQQEVNARQETVRNDDILSPNVFHALEYHPWSFPNEFKNIPRQVYVTMIKFMGFQKHFYVRISDKNEEYMHMHTKIQNLAENYQNKHRSFSMRDWNKNDACLVYCKTKNTEETSNFEWHRAIIVGHDDEDEMIVVNLIDMGLKKSCKPENIIPMPTSMSTINSFAIRCILPNFDIVEDEEYQEIESHWKDTFEENDRIPLCIEPIECMNERKGLVVKLFSKNTQQKYIDLLASLRKCIREY